MNDLFTLLKPKIDALIAQAKSAAADGRITLIEAWGILQSVLLLAYEAAAGLSLSGAEKKVAVMHLLTYVFDTLFPLLSLSPRFAFAQYALSWVFGAGWERKAFLLLADRAIEGIHSYFKPKSAPAVVVPAPAPAPAGK